VELLFSTHIGSVLAMAELLSPCSSAPIGLQPFRFVAMDSTELRKLRAAIASSQKTEAESPSASPLAMEVGKPEVWPSLTPLRLLPIDGLPLRNPVR
jgi:hypothetical protein